MTTSPHSKPKKLFRLATMVLTPDERRMLKGDRISQAADDILPAQLRAEISEVRGEVGLLTAALQGAIKIIQTGSPKPHDRRFSTYSAKDYRDAILSYKETGLWFWYENDVACSRIFSLHFCCEHTGIPVAAVLRAVLPYKVTWAIFQKKRMNPVTIEPVTERRARLDD